MNKLNFSLRNISVIGGLTLISRALGCVREMLVASFLGASNLADVFALATKLPSMFRRLAADGSLNIAFIPIFTQLKSDKDSEAAYAFAGRALFFLIFLLLFFVSFLVVFLRPMLHVIAPRFFISSQHGEMLVTMCRITLPYIFFISLTAFYGSILNAFGRFVPLALSPVLGNLSLIFFIVFYYMFFPNILMYGLAYGVVVSGAVQCVFVMMKAKHFGIRLRLKTFSFTPLMQRFLKAFSTSFLSASLLHLNVLISMVLALNLPYGTLSCLSYADRLIQVPASVLGASIATTLLPLLSQQHAAGNIKEAYETCCRALRLCLWFVLPCIIYLSAMRTPLVQVIYGRGRFDAIAIARTSESILIFATALPAWMGIRVLNAHFFAVGYVHVTLWASLLNVALDVALAIILAPILAHQGIALAVSLAAWGQLILLLFFTRKWMKAYKIFFGWHFLRHYLSLAVLLGVALLLSNWVSYSWGLWWNVGVTSLGMGALFLIYVHVYNVFDGWRG